MRGMGNMQGMMKQMQKLQKEMAESQEKINQTEFKGSASNGMVEVTFSGDRKMKDVKIKPEAVDPDDVEMLQDLVLMAVTDALKQIEEKTESTMGRYTKGIPGL